MHHINIHPINVNGGDTLRIALDAPPQGEIMKVLIVQTDGPRDGFKHTIYNAARGCPPGLNLDIGPDEYGLIVREYECQITQTVVVPKSADRAPPGADGVDRAFWSFGVYANDDGEAYTAMSKLYVKLEVLDSANGAHASKVFGVFMQIDPSPGA